MGVWANETRHLIGAGVTDDHQTNVGVLIRQIRDHATARGAQRYLHVRVTREPRAESLIELFIGHRPEVPAPHTHRHQNRLTQPRLLQGVLHDCIIAGFGIDDHRDAVTGREHIVNAANHRHRAMRVGSQYGRGRAQQPAGRASNPCRSDTDHRRDARFLDQRCLDVAPASDGFDSYRSAGGLDRSDCRMQDLVAMTDPLGLGLDDMYQAQRHITTDRFVDRP